jgi:hypothetical protein
MKPGIKPVMRRAAAGLFGVGAYIAMANLHGAGSSHLAVRSAAHPSVASHSLLSTTTFTGTKP